MWTNQLLLIFFKYYKNNFFFFFPFFFQSISLPIYIQSTPRHHRLQQLQRQPNLLQLHFFYFSTTYLLPIFLFYSHQHTQLNYFSTLFLLLFLLFLFLLLFLSSTRKHSGQKTASKNYLFCNVFLNYLKGRKKEKVSKCRIIYFN